ncbi:hypothetical protein ACFWIP_21910 [Streptomyces anulatus]|uniref:hypothetical protein n=1 Tax=Streptomyces anulatus TaxID=1892 RepID=UPI003646AB2A
MTDPKRIAVTAAAALAGVLLVTSCGLDDDKRDCTTITTVGFSPRPAPAPRPAPSLQKPSAPKPSTPRVTPSPSPNPSPAPRTSTHCYDENDGR